MVEYYNRQGERIRHARYLQFFDEPSYYRVAFSTVTNEDDPACLYEVSTVWTGHPYPSIFETMVTAPIEEPRFWKWRTVDAAGAGHKAVTAEIAATLSSPRIKNPPRPLLGDGKVSLVKNYRLLAGILEGKARP